MKVLHVIPSLAAIHGGPTAAMETMERALSRHGVTVETATTDDAGAGARLRREIGTPVSENGVCRRYFPKAMDFYKFSPAFARWIHQHAADYDLLHIHALFSFTSTAAGLAARRAKVPYIVRPLGTLMRYGLAQRRPILKRISLRFIESRILQGAAAVHVTSLAELEQIRETGLAVRCARIPLAVERGDDQKSDRLFDEHPELRDRKIVLFIGRLDPVKNLEGLLEAMSLCVRSVPEAVLVVGGSGPRPYCRQLLERTARFGLQSHVHWAGQMDQPMKSSALRRASAFALVSLSENFGIAAAEALAAGVPCVLSDGVAIAREVTEAGAGVTVRSEPASISEGLLRLLTDESGRAAAAKRALEFSSQNFAPEKVASQLAELYAAVVHRAHAQTTFVTSQRV